MKIIFPTLLLTSFAIAATPDIQIKCIDEVGTSSWLSEILIELDCAFVKWNGVRVTAFQVIIEPN